MTQLQRDVLQLASGDGRSTRYAMLANALLLLLAPLPTDITEQVSIPGNTVRRTVCRAHQQAEPTYRWHRERPKAMRLCFEDKAAPYAVTWLLLCSVPTLWSVVQSALCCCRRRSTGWACYRAASCRTRLWPSQRSLPSWAMAVATRRPALDPWQPP